MITLTTFLENLSFLKDYRFWIILILSIILVGLLVLLGVLCSKIKNERKYCKEMLSKHSSEESRFKSDIQNLREKNENLKNSLNKKDSEISTLRLENDRKDFNIRDMEKNAKLVREQYAKEEELNKITTTRCINLSKEIETLNAEIERLNQELTNEKLKSSEIHTVQINDMELTPEMELSLNEDTPISLDSDLDEVERTIISLMRLLKENDKPKKVKEQTNKDSLTKEEQAVVSLMRALSKNKNVDLEGIKRKDLFTLAKVFKLTNYNKMNKAELTKLIREKVLENYKK